MANSNLIMEVLLEISNPTYCSWKADVQPVLAWKMNDDATKLPWCTCLKEFKFIHVMMEYFEIIQLINWKSHLQYICTGKLQQRIIVKRFLKFEPGNMKVLERRLNTEYYFFTVYFLNISVMNSPDATSHFGGGQQSFKMLWMGEIWCDILLACVIHFLTCIIVCNTCYHEYGLIRIELN